MDSNDLKVAPEHVLADVAIKPGKWITAFDSAGCAKVRFGTRCDKLWWKPAQVIKVYFDGENERVDLVWLGKEEIVRGVLIEDTNQLTPYWNLFVKNFLDGRQKADGSQA